MEHFDEILALKVDHYIEQLFIGDDPVLTQNLADADAAGLPEINVSPNEGRLLYLLAKMSRAQRILEVGTLGGYSTTCLARALPATGKLVSLELEPLHVRVARNNLERAGLGGIVQIIEGDAVASLQALCLKGEPFDLIFLDANKPGYPKYLEFALQLARPGTVILADNVVRNGRVLSPEPGDENARAVQQYLNAVAANKDLESIVLPIVRDSLDGLAISIVR